MQLHRSWDQVGLCILVRLRREFWRPNSVIGPIASGWIAETRLGWRFNFWLMFIFSGLSLLFGFLVTSETVSHSGIFRRVYARSNLNKCHKVCTSPSQETCSEAHERFERRAVLHFSPRSTSKLVVRSSSSIEPEKTFRYASCSLYTVAKSI